MAGGTGAVVVIDVLRAFTTGACALAPGAEAIHLVAGVDEAVDFKAANPGVLAIAARRRPPPSPRRPWASLRLRHGGRRR
ncbi:MAG: 2-phosphosulfolactate phosphatase [Acidimicrobiales bacterium]